MENKGNFGIAILLGAMVLFVMEARADIPKTEKLIWAEECPTDFRYDEGCKKKVYIDESIKEEDITWEEIDKIAKREFFDKKTLKDIFKNKFLKNEIDWR